jgi:hypothetical protein
MIQCSRLSNKNGKIEATSLYQQFLQAAGDIKPVQMVIASSANVFAVNGNDRAQVQQFIGLLARLAMVTQGLNNAVCTPELDRLQFGLGAVGQHRMAQRGSGAVCHARNQD